MARDTVDLTPIEGRDALVSWFTEGNKPASRFRIGTEHEKFPFYAADHSPVPYEGPRGIRALLEGPARGAVAEPPLAPTRLQAHDEGQLRLPRAVREPRLAPAVETTGRQRGDKNGSSGDENDDV